MADIEAWAHQETSADQTPPPAAEAQGYSFHERPDGTAMHATDVVDAIKRGCTGLADMDREEADALFQLAAQPVEAPAERPAPKVRHEAKPNKAKLEQEKPEPPKLDKVIIEPKVLEQPRVVESPVIEQARVLPHATKDIEVENVVFATPAIKHEVHEMGEKLVKEPAPTLQKAESTLPTRKPQPIGAPASQAVAVEAHTQHQLLMHEKAVPSSSAAPLAAEQPPTKDAANMVEPSTEATSLPRETFTFEADTADTFEPEAEQAPDSAQAAEVATIREFKTLVSSELAGQEAPLPLETIQAQANEQPLEQTLAQLASTLEAVESDDLTEIIQIVEKALPAGRIEKDDYAIELQPAVTEKLLLLLSQLGYEHPEEILKEFVRMHGSATLLQILAYLYQLHNHDSTNERLTTSTLYAAVDENTVRLRVGKILFGLITKFVAPIAAA